MTLERASGNVMQWFLTRLLLPSEQPPRQHGATLVKWGLISFGAWLATTLIGAWLLLPPEPSRTPDIGHASKGPPVKITEADEQRIRSEGKWIVKLVMLPFFALIFWGCHSSLMIGAGIFERLSGCPFSAINDWFDRLVWYKKIVAFPALLAAMFVVIGMPFIVLGIVGELTSL